MVRSCNLYPNVALFPGLSQYEAEEHTAAEFKEEVKERVKLRDNLLLTVPQSVVIGPFLVNVELTRNALVNKSQELIDKMLLMFARRLRSQVDEVDTLLPVLSSFGVSPSGLSALCASRRFSKSTRN